SKRIAEEAEAIGASTAGLIGVGVNRETCYHSNVGIDRVPDRYAFLLEDAIIVVNPLLSLERIDERECKNPDPVASGHLGGSVVVVRLEQANHRGGWGRWTGFGTRLRQGISKYWPLKPG